MKKNLYYKLEIWTPEEGEEEDEVGVSKIFYEGREGQKYTVRVLDKFFSILKKQAMNFAQQFGIEDEKSTQNKVERRQKVNKNICFYFYKHFLTISNFYSRNQNKRNRLRVKMTKQGSEKPLHQWNQVQIIWIMKASKIYLELQISKNKSKITDINDAIEVDSHVLNYGIVNPGKLLGSILVVTNISESEQTIDLSLD